MIRENWGIVLVIIGSALLFYSFNTYYTKTKQRNEIRQAANIALCETNGGIALKQYNGEINCVTLHNK